LTTTNEFEASEPFFDAGIPQILSENDVNVNARAWSYSPKSSILVLQTPNT
jgi:hypothetical protein